MIANKKSEKVIPEHLPDIFQPVFAHIYIELLNISRIYKASLDLMRPVETSLFRTTATVFSFALWSLSTSFTINVSIHRKCEILETRARFTDANASLQTYGIEGDSKINIVYTPTVDMNSTVPKALSSILHNQLPPNVLPQIAEQYQIVS